MVNMTKQYRRSDFRVWRKKGFDAERDLVRRLRKLGFWCVRIPTSASSKEPLPDVFAVEKKDRSPKRMFAFEVKAISFLPRFTIKKEQIQKLFLFLEPFRKSQEYKPFPCVAFKFLRGRRRKAHWIIKLVKQPQDLTMDITDRSDLEISKPSRKLVRYIRERRKHSESNSPSS